MTTLIVEDDFTVRFLLQRMLAPFGECHVAVDGEEAVEAFQIALDAGKPYDLVSLDIMMPGMDGQAALKLMREMEEARGIVSVNGSKIVMVSALGDYRSISTAHWNLCDAYLVKPIDRATLLKTLADLQLIPAQPARAAAPGLQGPPAPAAHPPAPVAHGQAAPPPAADTADIPDAVPDAAHQPPGRLRQAATKKVKAPAAPRRTSARPTRH
jgi:two-component system, chemotaxis family, chemotaxis protein CheY